MCSATTAPVCLGLARGSKPEFFQKDRGDDEADRNPMFNGRRQPSRGGTSRMMREYQVRFCERLGVKFPRPEKLPLEGLEMLLELVRAEKMRLGGCMPQSATDSLVACVDDKMMRDIVN